MGSPDTTMTRWTPKQTHEKKENKALRANIKSILRAHVACQHFGGIPRVIIKSWIEILSSQIQEPDGTDLQYINYNGDKKQTQIMRQNVYL